MSDELIEGHALRGKPSETEREPSKLLPRVRKNTRPNEESTGPYIILEPPQEAGDVMAYQSEMATFHKGMQPIVVDEATHGQPGQQPPQEAASTEESSLAPDLPWEVIESTASESSAPAQTESMKATQEPTSGLPSDFLPHFHTPTGVFPPIKEDLPDAQATETPESPIDPEKTSGETPFDFLPHFHTPTNVFPPIEDELLPDREAGGPEPTISPEIPSTETPSDFVPHFHTPTGVFQPIQEELPPDQNTASPEPAISPEEPSEELVFGEILRTETPMGIFSSIKDEIGSIEEEEEEEEEIPPVAPISSDPSEFIPLLHTPTGMLPKVPEEMPILQRNSSGAARAETAAAIDTEVLTDIDKRLERARRKMQATADEKTTGGRKLKSRLLTILAVIVITILVVIISLSIRGFLRNQASPSATPGSTFPTPTGAASAGDGTPGAALLLTPTVTAIPDYSHGRLVFSSNRDGNFEIYMLEMKNGQFTRLTNDPAADRAPKWSPDSRQLIFVSNRSGNDDLYLLSNSAEKAIRLTTDPGSDRSPNWSPDGKRIVFSRETVDGSNLVTMPTSCLSQPDTCEGLVTALTPGGYDLCPAWSPDSKLVAFAGSDHPGEPSIISLINSGGDGYQTLPGTGTSDTYPAWSPDGKRIAFVSYAQGDYDLWVMGADGKELLQLTQSESLDVEPAWSPDGGYIVFASDRSTEGDFELYLLCSDCTSPATDCEATLVQLTDDNTDDLNPDWAP